MVIDEYLQVKLDEVYNSPEFIPVNQGPRKVGPEPYTVGWAGRFTFFQIPPEHLAQLMNDWLIQENELLKDEVEELQLDLEKARQMCDWQSGWEKGRG